MIKNFLLAFALALPAGAVTVTNYLIDCVADPASIKYVIFSPGQTPNFDDSGRQVLDYPRRGKVDTNGFFSINLLGGDYSVDFGAPNKTLNIRVPWGDTNSYGLKTLAEFYTSGQVFYTNRWQLISSRVVGSGVTTNNPGSIFEQVVINAQAPSATNFMSTQFAVTGDGKVALKSGAQVTNLNVRTVGSSGGIEIDDIAGNGNLLSGFDNNASSVFTFNVAGLYLSQGYFGMAGLTPQTLVYADGFQHLVSLANSDGYLKNTSGTLSYDNTVASKSLSQTFSGNQIITGGLRVQGNITNDALTANTVLLASANKVPTSLASPGVSSILSNNASGQVGWFPTSNLGGSTNDYIGTAMWNVKAFGAVGDNSTDDTTAIQTAITYVTGQGGGTLFFPPGTYKVNGPFQDIAAGHANAQLVVPVIAHPLTDMVTVHLLGPVIPGRGMADVTDNNSNLLQCATIRSTVTQTNGDESILGTYYSGFSGFNPVTIHIENMVFNVGNNPTMSGLNLRNFFSTKLDNVIVWTGFGPVVTAQPTHIGSTGIMLPTNNNAAFNIISDVDVSGFYSGLELGEHTSGNNFIAWYCSNAIRVPFGFHASHFDRAMFVQCPVGLKVVGAQTLIIDELDIEHSNGGWNAPIYDIDDGSNLARGDIVWHSVLEGSGVEHNFYINGATGWNIKEVSTVEDPRARDLSYGTNLLSSAIVSPTNALPGGSAIDFSVRSATTNMTGNLTWSSLANFNNTNYDWAIRHCVNTSGSDKTVTANGSGWRLDIGSGGVYTVTNGTTRDFWIERQAGQFTNIFSVTAY